MNRILLINPEGATEEEVATYRVREAARAVVFDAENNIALLQVSNWNYYKLPGGGLEGSEDMKVALQHECLEEIGCEVEVVGEVGSLIEYRKMFGLKQISYCYLAKVKGEKGKPNFTEDEISGGFEQIWVPFEKALELMKGSDVTDPEGKLYIVPRDIALLKEVKKLIKRDVDIV